MYHSSGIILSRNLSSFLSSFAVRLVLLAMSRRRSNSSLEKVMESPFSVRDINGLNSVHEIVFSKKSHSRASFKMKTRSAPCGKKLKKRKQKQDLLPGAISKKYDAHASFQSLTSPALYNSTHSSIPLAKIDSPHLLHRKADYKLHKTFKELKQSESHTHLISPSSLTLPPSKPNHVNIKLRSSSITSTSSTTAEVNLKFSHNYSTNLRSRQRYLPKTISRVPFSLKRDMMSGTSSDVFGVEQLALGLKTSKFKKVVVMTGAGTSTASGIPDFRTPGTGLYDNLKQYQIPEPSAIFDITYFVRNPRPFFTLARELYPGKYSPNIAHYFVRLLQEKDLLLRHYTQNIDGLERLAGVRPGKLVESHGSFSTASCTVCQSKHDPIQTKELIFKNKTPLCKHKLCRGMVKPDIVFFGEDLPHRFHALRHMDLSQCDLLIVMGTSLEVEPFASLVTLTRYNVPRVLVNREKVGPFKQQRKRSKDVSLTGDISERLSEIVKLAGWTKELDELMSAEKKVEEVTSSDKGGAKIEMASSQTAENMCIIDDKESETSKGEKCGLIPCLVSKEHDCGLRETGISNATSCSKLTTKDSDHDECLSSHALSSQDSINKADSIESDLSKNLLTLSIKEKR